MIWTQEVNPLNNIGLSAAVAAVPVIFIFWALVIKKMKGYMASLLTLLVAILVSVFVYGMPSRLALMSSVHGALYGLFPICWIIIGALFLYNITVKSGQFEIIKSFMASITSDRRLQALLIAFSFGAFLEGAAGFGTPVAITAAMLVGLGFNPLYAAGICLIANTAPVAFGSIGTPIIIASQVSDLPEMAISQMVGRTLPLLSVFVPFYLVVLIAGFKRSLEVLPAIMVCGISFAFFQWFASNFLGPNLPDVIAGLASIISLMVLLKYWKPKSIWYFKEEDKKEKETILKYSYGQVFRAWSPFVIMTIMIIAWGLPPVKETLNSIGDIKFLIPGLQNAILRPDGSPLIVKPFDFNYLSSPGLALILSAFISMPLIGLSLREGAKTFHRNTQTGQISCNHHRFRTRICFCCQLFSHVGHNGCGPGKYRSTLPLLLPCFRMAGSIPDWIRHFIKCSVLQASAYICQFHRNRSSGHCGSKCLGWGDGKDDLSTVNSHWRCSRRTGWQGIRTVQVYT